MSTPVGNSAANASGNGPASGYSLKLWLFILFMLICVISINMFTCFILLLKVIEILLVYTFNFGIKLCPKLPKYLTTDNSYRHIKWFTMLCHTVQQDGVPLAWFRWNLFPYSLAEEARRWFALASFEVKGNWDHLMKKFCERFFPLSKVQHIRKQVINFAQGEEEGIDQAWDRFNGLIEQGPKLGFSGEVLLHTFYFSLTPECMQFVQMCAEGDLMEKTLTEAAQLLQKISKGAAMRRDWEKRCSASSEEESQ